MTKYQKNRTKTVFVFTFILVASFGYIRDKTIKRPLPEVDPIPDWFWLQKVNNYNKYNTAIIGDSRVYRGISVTEMENELNGAKIINLGLSSGGLNPEIYRLAINKLDNISSQRRIIISISPYSLTQESTTNSQYKELLEKTKQIPPWETNPEYEKIKLFFSPMHISDLIYFFKHQVKPKYRYIQVPHKGGWLASTRMPADEKIAIPEYEKLFSKEHVSKELIAKLMTQISNWTKEGICVYGLRLPTSPVMTKLENDTSGINESEIRQNFLKAGGIWIDITSPDTYRSYDGSHLEEASARKLSTEISKVINNIPCSNN